MGYENATERRIGNIVDAMDLAYGGRSQWGPADLGRAIAGQVRNNGLGSAARDADTVPMLQLCRLAALAACGDDDDDDGVRAYTDEVYAAASAASAATAAR